MTAMETCRQRRRRRVRAGPSSSLTMPRCRRLPCWRAVVALPHRPALAARPLVAAAAAAAACGAPAATVARSRRMSRGLRSTLIAGRSPQHPSPAERWAVGVCCRVIGLAVREPSVVAVHGMRCLEEMGLQFLYSTMVVRPHRSHLHHI